MFYRRAGIRHTSYQNERQLWPLPFDRALVGLALALLVAGAGAGRCAAADAGVFALPRFPSPALARNEYGEVREIGFLWFVREFQVAGVHGLDDVDFVDDNYAVLDASSLPVLAAWMEAACRGIGTELHEARKGPYDGMAYARLLEIATSLASLRGHAKARAMPIGVIICRRREAWGGLPGDGARDAYLLIATDRGLLVYDPPTRQLSSLGEFPNKDEVYKIQF